ncbi:MULTISPECIES: protein tyrosine phosphatase [Klebsiella]|uniref:arsenate reductase/protein-tyrosine-phosphatase family protein n=1 Tax=Klebsiella TaxID=570 RepID=UPI000907FC15|nr:MULTISPECIES: protein tyrosine phosphatase [Klebsiella]UVG22374.1 protein tyrosine phosphatase [Klebsiella quasipneumoniae]HBR1319113.1 protein tyrosine phosphatase [Klebsiella quasipneumoniae subsp. quasipneumoniae]HCI5764531.1 protein tyrosine phosphatase [Klebsiella quasipneumoniae subsp. quasipneumoniae]HDT2605288.1 protein tyrosine phosphatase [Klebsiella quasipneumoniae subsp. similipneumoniae]
MFDSILVICTGNICRSPLGEHLLRKILPNKIIDSAGTAALVDHEADSSAQKIAIKNGISLQGHQAKQFTPSLGRKYDLLLVMDKSHIEYISSIAPEIRGKLFLFGYWIDQKEIPDPYRKSDEAFSSVFSLIEKASKAWVEKLNG